MKDLNEQYEVKLRDIHKRLNEKGYNIHFHINNDNKPIVSFPNEIYSMASQNEIKDLKELLLNDYALTLNKLQAITDIDNNLKMGRIAYYDKPSTFGFTNPDTTILYYESAKETLFSLITDNKSFEIKRNGITEITVHPSTKEVGKHQFTYYVKGEPFSDAQLNTKELVDRLMEYRIHPCEVIKPVIEILNPIPFKSERQIIEDLYSSDFPSIKYIDDRTVKILAQLNLNEKTPLSFHNLKLLYESKGKQLESDFTADNLDKFHEIESVMNDFKSASLKDKQIKAQEKAQEMNQIKSMEMSI